MSSQSTLFFQKLLETYYKSKSRSNPVKLTSSGQPTPQDKHMDLINQVVSLQVEDHLIDIAKLVDIFPTNPRPIIYRQFVDRFQGWDLIWPYENASAEKIELLTTAPDTWDCITELCWTFVVHKDKYIEDSDQVPFQSGARFFLNWPNSMRYETSIPNLDIKQSTWHHIATWATSPKSIVQDLSLGVFQHLKTNYFI